MISNIAYHYKKNRFYQIFYNPKTIYKTFKNKILLNHIKINNNNIIITFSKIAKYKKLINLKTNPQRMSSLIIHKQQYMTIKYNYHKYFINLKHKIKNNQNLNKISIKRYKRQ